MAPRATTAKEVLTVLAAPMKGTVVDLGNPLIMLV